MANKKMSIIPDNMVFHLNRLPAYFLIMKGNDIIFVVYTERIQSGGDMERKDIIRLISARFATNFERGLYYGKY